MLIVCPIMKFEFDVKLDLYLDIYNILVLIYVFHFMYLKENVKLLNIKMGALSFVLYAVIILSVERFFLFVLLPPFLYRDL